MATAKVVQSGNRQALRFPKDLRFPAGIERVSIRRQGDRIILEPLEGKEWPEEFWQAFEGMSPDFKRPEQSPADALRALRGSVISYTDPLEPAD
jgi:virulence-associated protein VagC